MSEDQVEYVITDKVGAKTIETVRCLLLELLEGIDREYLRDVLDQVGMTREEFEKFMKGGA